MCLVGLSTHVLRRPRKRFRELAFRAALALTRGECRTFVFLRGYTYMYIHVWTLTCMDEYMWMNNVKTLHVWAHTCIYYVSCMPANWNWCVMCSVCLLLIQTVWVCVCKCVYVWYHCMYMWCYRTYECGSSQCVHVYMPMCACMLCDLRRSSETWTFAWRFWHACMCVHVCIVHVCWCIKGMSVHVFS
jgi:hypothetical protein